MCNDEETDKWWQVTSQGFEFIAEESSDSLPGESGHEVDRPTDRLESSDDLPDSEEIPDLSREYVEVPNGGDFAAFWRDDGGSLYINGVAQVDGRPATFRDALIRTCQDMLDFLLAKNEAYGNSISEPIGIFSKLSPREGVRLRIDDKLKRIKNGSSYLGDNDRKDLTGYLIADLALDLLEKS